MQRLFYWMLAAALLALLSACSGTRKSVYAPSVNIQQLVVEGNGEWRLNLRILNNSYARVHFTHITLDFDINNAIVAHIDETLDLTIPALSADTTSIRIKPPAAAREALAAIGDQGSLAYALSGTAEGAPAKAKKAQRFDVQGQDWLSAVPGVANIYR